MVFVLFVFSAAMAYYGYNYTKLRALSPTFWGSIVFTIFAFIYSITIFNMRSDISITTALIVVGFLFVTMLGEYFASHIIFRCSFLESEAAPLNIATGYIRIEKWKIHIVTLLFMYVAVDRYRNLTAVASAYAGGGNFDGVMQMMMSARLAFVASNKNLTLSSTLFNQLIYSCEISSYIMVFIFINNLINYKRKDFYLLLVCMPDIFIRFLSTSRTSFITFVMAIIVSFLLVIQKQKELKKIRIPKKLIIGGIIFVIIFMVYGRIRNQASAIPWITYIQMYTCSSLYGLEFMISNGWNANPYFGFNTLTHIYDLLGIEHSTVRTWTKMLEFSKNSDAHANLYTSLFWPIQDYGVIVLLFSRLLCAFIAARIILKVLKTRPDNKMFFVYLFFCITLIYVYFYSAIGDIFIDVFLNPSMMIRYFVYGWLIVRFYYKPKCIL